MSSGTKWTIQPCKLCQEPFVMNGDDWNDGISYACLKCDSNSLAKNVIPHWKHEIGLKFWKEQESK